ncbi:hypothetical protein NQ318_007201 [Aromia moschata]|uniref:NADH dehydrogenase [ubiquinone] 1 alpha subcomplex subunit 11 n=1 Tax=Aromia moschata TaxID=1265417 RepID=A0AAV8X7Q9_9CUCU|nr:hypothetical protein NQ318_007201 [Aromia moschata]
MDAKPKPPSRYFERPDGEDVLGKWLHVMKPTLLTAFGISTVDVMCYSHPKGYLATLGRYAYIGLPLVGVSTAFVCTTNMAASLRKKDDKKRPIIGFNMGMALGLFAVIKKVSCDNGWNLFPAMT